MSSQEGGETGAGGEFQARLAQNMLEEDEILGELSNSLDQLQRDLQDCQRSSAEAANMEQAGAGCCLQQ